MRVREGDDLVDERVGVRGDGGLFVGQIEHNTQFKHEYETGIGEVVRLGRLLHQLLVFLARRRSDEVPRDGVVREYEFRKDVVFPRLRRFIHHRLCMLGP